MKHDVSGRYYALIDHIKQHDVLEADAGFTCLKKGAHCTVELDEGLRFFIQCAKGRHYLEGQDDGDGYLVGLYKVEASP